MLYINDFPPRRIARRVHLYDVKPRSGVPMIGEEYLRTADDGVLLLARHGRCGARFNFCNPLVIRPSRFNLDEYRRAVLCRDNIYLGILRRVVALKDFISLLAKQPYRRPLAKVSEPPSFGLDLESLQITCRGTEGSSGGVSERGRILLRHPCDPSWDSPCASLFRTPDKACQARCILGHASPSQEWMPPQ